MELTKLPKFEISLFGPDFDLADYRRRTITADMKADYESPNWKMSVSNGVAIIPILGPICKYTWPGEVDPMGIVRDANRAAADESVKAVMVRVDSPGGTIAGIEAAGNAIASLSAKKKTFTFAEDDFYSAAYWIGSQASKLYLSSGTAGAGSIGVRTALIDASKMFSDMGVTFHPINTGKFKNVGDYTQPVTEDAKAYIQAEVDILFDAFVDAVASGRKLGKKTIREMEARIYTGQKAVDAGLVDAILPIETVYGMLTKEANRGVINSRASASLALARAMR